MEIFQVPKIVHQGIDFLTIDYFSRDFITYQAKFVPMLDKLQELKEKAQLQDTFGHKFIKSDLGLNLGDFFVSSRGTGRFAYYIENNDYRIFISKAKIGGDLPQIRVEIPPKTINLIGIEKSIKMIEVFIEKLIGSNYKRKVNRIDLCTDVWGIMYSALDLHCFQTRMKVTQYKEDYNIGYVRFQKVQGFQFGGSDGKLIRIYDKTHKINISPSESYIREIWKYNGYKDDTYPVYRHEIQLRREELKTIIPKNLDDEVDYILRMRGNIWFKYINLVEYVNLTEKEILKVTQPLINSSTRRSIFYRAKKDKNRFHFWQILQVWENRQFEAISKIPDIKEYGIELLEKQLKGFISTYYKVVGRDISKLPEIVEKIEEKLYEKENITLDIYALSKLAGSFIKNYESVLMTGDVFPQNQYEKVVDFYDVFKELSFLINNKDYKRIFRKVVNYV